MEKTCKSCNRVYSRETDFLAGTSRWRICTSGNLWFECQCNSTLMIPKGKFPWYDPVYFMRPATQSVFNRLSGMQDLPYISNTIMELLAMMDDEDYDVKAISAEVKREPFIATEVFRIATNLRDSRSPGKNPLESLEHAIMYVGLGVLKDLVTTASLKSFKFKGSAFSPEVFWREAHLCGYISEKLSRRLRLNVNSDEAYLAGLLANIGKLVGAICLPQETDHIFSLTRDPNTAKPWLDLEANERLTSHVVLGEIGSTIWGFPAFITEAIAAHHDTQAVDLHALRARTPEFYFLIGLANQMTHWVLLQPERIDIHQLYDFGKMLGLSRTQIDKLGEELMPLRHMDAA